MKFSLFITALLAFSAYADEVTKEEFYDRYHGNYITDPENPTTYIKVPEIAD